MEQGGIPESSVFAVAAFGVILILLIVGWIAWGMVVIDPRKTDVGRFIVSIVGFITSLVQAIGGTTRATKDLEKSLLQIQKAPKKRR